MYDKILEALRKLPKGILLSVIYDLMQSGKLSFTDIALTHEHHLEQLRKGQSEHYDRLKSKVIDTFCDSKENYDKNIKDAMHYLLDCGEVNLTHEKINAK